MNTAVFMMSWLEYYGIYSIQTQEYYGIYSIQTQEYYGGNELMILSTLFEYT